MWRFDLRASDRGQKSSVKEKTLTLILDSHDVEGRLVRKVRYEYRSCLQSVDKAVKHNGDYFEKK